jgi:hypothetical protein
MVRRFVVVREKSTLLEHHQRYFPNLEVGMTIDGDVSEDWGHRASLLIAGPVTRERLAEFFELPLVWDREPFSPRCSFALLTATPVSAAESHCQPVKRLHKLIFDRTADIIPYTTSALPTMGSRGICHNC